MINGIGGVGKTSLASYYLQSQKEKFDYCGFLKDINSFHIEFSYALNLKAHKLEEAFIETIQKLQKLKGKKLLVIDDVKNIEESTEALEMILNLKEFGYKLLFTSRENIENENVIKYELNVLNMEDAKKLFTSIYPIEDEVLLETLLTYLDCHTLFVELTAKTLRSKKILTAIKLKEMFENGEFPQIHKSRKESFEGYLNKLFSFENLDNEEILFLKKMSVLPSIHIEFEYLQSIFNKKNNGEFEDILNYLSHKGWLIKGENDYKLHQIIKEYILVNYSATFDEIEEIIVFFAQLIVDAIDINITIENRDKVVYFDSLIKVLEILKIGNEDEDFDIFFSNMGHIYRYLGMNKKVLSLYQKSLEIAKQYKDENDIRLGVSYNNMSLAYFGVLNFSKALEYIEKALIIYKKEYGDKSLEVAFIEVNHSLCLTSFSRYDEALVILKNTVSLYESLKGDSSIIAMANFQIGGILKKQFKHIEALAYFKKALEIWEKALNENHPNIINCNHEIATIYRAESQYDKALQMLEKSLDLNKEAWGYYHLNVGQEYNSLGYLYYSKKDYLQALENYDKALDIFIKVDNINLVAMVYNNKASIYCDLKEYIKAIFFYKKIIEINKEIFGERHENIVLNYYRLGVTYHALKEWLIAIDYYKDALRIREEISGLYHEDNALNHYSLGICYFQLKKYDEAIFFHRKALKVRKNILGVNNDDIGWSYLQLTLSYYMNKNFKEALKIINKILNYTCSYPYTIYQSLEKIFFAMKKYPYPYLRKSSYDDFVKKEIDNIMSFDTYFYSNTKKIIFTPIEKEVLLIRFYPTYIEGIQKLYDNEIEKQFTHFNFRNSYLEFRWESKFFY